MHTEGFGRLPSLPEGLMPAHLALAGILSLAITTARRGTTDVERASSLSGLAELSTLLSLADFSREQVDEVIRLVRQAYDNSTLKVSGDPRRPFTHRPRHGRAVVPHNRLGMVEATVTNFFLGMRAETIMRGRKKPFHFALVDQLGELVADARVAASKADMVGVWKNRAMKGRVTLARSSWGMMYLCLVLQAVELDDSAINEIVPRLINFAKDTVDLPEVQEHLVDVLFRYGM